MDEGWVLAGFAGRSVLVLSVVVWYATAADVPVSFSDTLIVSGLSNPTAMAFAPDGRLFVCEQAGRLRVVKGGTLLPVDFARFSVDSASEQGLLGIAFDPNFATNQYVYVYYTVPTQPPHNRLSRVTASGDVMVLGSEIILMEFESLSGGVHNGGALNFLNGKLFVAVGENAKPANSQSLNSCLGKLLRLNPDGSIPVDNPFYNTASGLNRAIWALGLRNPFTFAVQPGTGRLFINDVGSSSWEEINEGVAGANYGWPATEGVTSNSQFRSPLYAYGHGIGATIGCAITGGTFYNPTGQNFPIEYIGSYFFADYCSGWIRRFDPVTGTISGFAIGISAPVDLKTGPEGGLYYLARGGGAVNRIDFAVKTLPTITIHPSSRTVSSGQPAEFSVVATGSAPLQYQWLRNSVAISGAVAATYRIESARANDNGVGFRVIVSNDLGSVTSNLAYLTVTPNRSPTVSITTPLASTLYTAGTAISYSGTASDPEDGILPGSAFTWRIDFHHDTHSHPFYPATSGATAGVITIPNSGELSTNVWYRFHLTVRDSAGLTTTLYRDVLPRKVTLTVQTSPPGLQILYNGRAEATPLTVGAVAGMIIQLAAPTPQPFQNVAHEFVSWSNGGAREQTLAAPVTNTTYTAVFQAATVGGVSVYLSDRPRIYEINGWGPAEKDRSNGENASGDGRVMTLNGVQYTKGIGVHANSDLRYSITGCSTFVAQVGIDDEVGNAGSVFFEVWADGVRLFTSGLMTGSSPTLPVSVNIAGKSELRLIVSNSGEINSDHADWADARLGCAAPGITTRHLSDLSPSVSINGWGPMELDRSNAEQAARDGTTLTINGVAYAKGLGVHARSDVGYILAGKCTTMTASIGIDDEVGSLGSVIFEVWADGDRLYSSGVMTGSDAAKPLNVDLSGRNELLLRVLDAGDIHYDHADWADAKISCQL